MSICVCAALPCCYPQISSFTFITQLSHKRGNYWSSNWLNEDAHLPHLLSSCHIMFVSLSHYWDGDTKDLRPRTGDICSLDDRNWRKLVSNPSNSLEEGHRSAAASIYRLNKSTRIDLINISMIPNYHTRILEVKLSPSTLLSLLQTYSSFV